MLACWFYFILFNVFCILVHDYTLCFIGSPCCSVSYYSYISVWPYYIVIHLLTGYHTAAYVWPAVCGACGEVCSLSHLLLWETVWGRHDDVWREDQQWEPHEMSADHQRDVPRHQDQPEHSVSSRTRVPSIHGAYETQWGRHSQVSVLGGVVPSIYGAYETQRGRHSQVSVLGGSSEHISCLWTSTRER